MNARILDSIKILIVFIGLILLVEPNIKKKPPQNAGANKAELESNRKPFLLKKPNYLVIVWNDTFTKQKKQDFLISLKALLLLSRDDRT